MPDITVSARAGAPQDTAADTRVVPLFEGEQLEETHLQELVSLGEAKPALRKVALVHEDAPGGGRRRVLIAGLGKREELDAEKARVAAAAAAGRAKELGAVSLSWAATPGVEAALVEGTLLALYVFDRFKTKKPDDEATGIESVEIAGADVDEGAVSRGRVVAVAQNAARDLQNLPANVADPQFLAGRAQEIAEGHESVELEIFDREAITSRGMGAFAAVAQGTDAEPRMIVLRYRGGENGPHLGFVGKAVTFDTGGISLKPGAKMSEMKFDMSGGAAVLEAMSAIATLRLPVTITAVVPATENMPSGRSVKPGDIVTAMNGKTIEINNTDAEGRLILADALAYAVEQGVERIVDLATLTGAIIVALGSTYAGLFSNDDAWYGEVEAACTATGELGWRLPLHPEYADLVKGKYADLDNAPEGRKASSITAAEFLKSFVGEVPWVHIDIAGTAWDAGRSYIGKGAAGFGVRTLVELAERSGAALICVGRLRLSAAGLAAAFVFCAGGCNGEDVSKPDPVRPPDELSRAQATALLGAQERLDQALRTVRTLRRSPAKARALHAKVREVISSGALESNELDDFGKAAVGELGLAVPSLVERDGDGVPESVDRDAVAAFLRHAQSDPARALVLPAREEVEAIEKTVESADAGAETRIPPQGSETLDLSVSEYLRDTQRSLAPTWPGLHDRLGTVREGLASSTAS